MKRKDMVIKIHNLLRNEDLVGTGYYEVADLVLNLIEKEGMTPPGFKRKPAKPGEGLPAVMLIRSWEPDEKT